MTHAYITTPDGAWSISLLRPPCVFPLSLMTALAMSTSATPVPISSVEKAEGLDIERGLVTDDLQEYFVSGSNLAGVLLLKRKEDGSWSAQLAKSYMPRVLSKEAVDSKLMPPDGTHGLPDSLASVIPQQYQFWKHGGDQARMIRDKLCSSGLFEDRLIKVVDGRLRLCMERLYLYTPEEVAEPSKVDALKRVIGSHADLPVETLSSVSEWDKVFKGPVAKSLVLISSEDEDSVVEVCDKLAADLPSTPWLIEHTNTDLARMSMEKVGRVFKLDADPESVYVASFDLTDVRGVTFLDSPTEKAQWSGTYMNDLPDSSFLYIEGGGEKDSEGKTKPRSLRHFPVKDKDGRVDPAHVRNALARIPQSNVPQSVKEKARAEATRMLENVDKAEAPIVFAKLLSKAEESAPVARRYVLGIVLEPETKDSQGDIYSVEEVEKACHTYMEKFQGTGLMHKESTAGKVLILENYLCPVDCTIEGQPVKKGTWMKAVRVIDDSIWKSIQEGTYTGFSIGGSAVRLPEPPPTQSVKP